MIYKKINQKGQGALEYLLLIGGAVLIAVIVIALLVGMGGQSRDTAADSADRAQQATAVPQPAQIVSIQAFRNDCITHEHGANVTLAWRPLGEGGAYSLIVRDSSSNDLAITCEYSDGTACDPDDLDPNENAGIIVTVNIEEDVDGDVVSNRCGDTYYGIIETERNQQTVQSQLHRFSWTK
jgi:hypothetical protein